MLTFGDDPCAVFAETDQLGVRARARGEALCRHVEALEQVGLAGAVGTDGEHDPRLEAELESGVRPVVAEGERPDDQPATKASLATPLSGRAGFARASV